ncbi:MAG: HigA family addiction module antidote protein [Rhodobacteraceae bacterium]|nr:HigA family addiction module antidote protein [Paracoccaceae bacterium]
MLGNPLLKGLRPTHPGELLREDILPALGLSKAAIAKRLGISRARLYATLGEKAPVTPAMALRLARLIGGNAEIWLSMQRAYDLRTLEAERADDLAAIQPVATRGRP